MAINLSLLKRQVSSGDGVQIATSFWDQPVYSSSKGVLTCPGYSGADYSNNVWDYLVVKQPSIGPVFAASDPQKTPGICEVSVEKRRDVDKKKVPGADGARITIHGVEPAEVEIRLTIWTPNQLAKLQGMWQQLFPGTQKVVSAKSLTTASSLDAWDVHHPVLDIHQIKSLIFVSGSGPGPGPTQRSRTFVMRGIEFIPITANVTTKTISQSKGVASTFEKPSQPTPGTNPKATGPRTPG